MSETTKIQWADATFNPWIGCTKVSAGCKNCYAENTTRARVLRGQGHETWGKGSQRSRTSAATWKGPLRWESECGIHPGYPHKVFPSLCDWLDDEVPIEWLADFLNLIHQTPSLSWLLLTKRPENFFSRIDEAINTMPNDPFVCDWSDPDEQHLMPENVWIGTSVENQEMADKRIPELLKIPATIRFLSCEPLLGPIDLRYSAFNGSDTISSIAGIHWVIVGGESGSQARRCDLGWIQDIKRHCQIANVPVFVKQLGGNLSDEDLSRCAGGSVHDKKGGDISEWPKHLQVRQFPLQPSSK